MDSLIAFQEVLPDEINCQIVEDLAKMMVGELLLIFIIEKGMSILLQIQLLMEY